jgi:hypothetical protein
LLLMELLLLPLLFLLSQRVNRLLHLRRRASLLWSKSATHPKPPYPATTQIQQLRLVGALQVNVRVPESRQLMVLEVTLQLRRRDTHLGL